MEEIGIIHGIGVGMRDADEPVLWFGVDCLGGSSFQAFTGKDIFDFIKKSEVYEIKQLENQACVVSTKDGIQKFVRLFNR